MSYDLIMELVDQLEHEKPRIRLQAIRRLAAIGDPRCITALNNVYANEDEQPEVRQAAKDALGVFKAIKEAIDHGRDVELPDPASVRLPRFTPELLRRLLVVLSVVLGVLLIVNVALLLIPVTRPFDAGEMLYFLQNRYEQVRQEVTKQQTAWQTLQNGGQLDCNPGLDPDPAAVDGSDLRAIQIDPETYGDLYRANLALISAVDQVILTSNNRLVSCTTGTIAGNADENLQRLTQSSAALDQVAQSLTQAGTLLAETAQPTQAPLDGAPTVVEATPIPSEEPPTATPGVVIDYATYIRVLRQQIEFVAGARGELTLLVQYWQDIQTAGQSSGCRQLLDPNAPSLADYTGLRPQDAAADPRLQNIVSTLNIGLALTRDSMQNFLNGCSANNFAPVLNVGQQQAIQGLSALNQVTALLDQIQAEVAP